MKQQNHKKYAIIGAGIATTALTAALLWGNCAITVTNYTLTCSKLPEAFEHYRIVQVSDLHNTAFGKDNQTLLKKIQEAKPDMIVITGDLIDSRRTNLEIALAFAACAVEIAPCYYVAGNHESRIDAFPELREGLEELGVQILANEWLSIEKDGQYIQIAGIFDPKFYAQEVKPEVVQKLLAKALPPDGYTILLAHRPEYFDVYAEQGVDLVFCGHAHGGQMRLPIVGGLYAPGQGVLPTYDAGVFQQNNTTMVVSRGLGNSLFPLRVNNRPELVVMELRCE